MLGYLNKKKRWRSVYRNTKDQNTQKRNRTTSQEVRPKRQHADP